jgi:hypothetical protein
LLYPPTSRGSIAASAAWRPIAPEPSLATAWVTWTAHGIVELGSDGAGAIYDPHDDAWRRFAGTSGLGGYVPASELVSPDTILFKARGRRDPYADLRAFDVKTTTWREIPRPPYGVGISSASAWTGSTLFLWGGVTVRANPALAADGSPEADSDVGAILDVAAGRWQPVASEGAPNARANALVAWTGSGFFVWGGASNPAGSGSLCRGGSSGREERCRYPTNGAMYDPAKQRWSALPTDGAPPRLVDAGILWTGSVVLLWDRDQASTAKVLYAYRPSTRVWLTPIAVPFQSWFQQGIAGGRVLFLDRDGGHVLDLETLVFTQFEIPPDLRRCWGTSQERVFEPSRLVFLAPPGCHDDTAAVAAFDPIKNTWKTAVLPPLPRPAKIPAARGSFGGWLTWTGEHLIAWGGGYRTDDNWNRGCEGARSPLMPACDPIGPSVTSSNEGFVIRPPL